ncbi:MAG: hypothetical protein ACQES2_06745 [Pseudomonadota bacterium]
MNQTPFKKLAVSAFLFFASAASAESLDIYWSVDGLKTGSVEQVAQRFASTVTERAGVKAVVTVADRKTVSEAAGNGSADLVVTCNEVASELGAPLAPLNSEPLSALECFSGSHRPDWALSMDIDAPRNNNGEVWVYLLRDSEHFARLRDMRRALMDIQKSLDLGAAVQTANLR